MSAADDSGGTIRAGSDDALIKGLVLAQHAGEIDPSEFVICKDEHGEDVCLGEGNFGKVSCWCCTRTAQVLEHGLLWRSSVVLVKLTRAA